MEKPISRKSVLSFALFTFVILALGFVMLQTWSTASAGYVDKVRQEVCLVTGKGGKVCFPENACLGKCLLDPGTSGNAGKPADALGKSSGDLLDSFYVQITDGTGKLVGENIEVCFENPGELFVYGLDGQNWGSPLETSLNEANGKYCVMVNAADVGVNAGLSFAYFE